VEDEFYLYRKTKMDKGETKPRWVQRKAKIDVTIGWKDLCERFGLNPKQFDRYRKMIDQSASMPGALSEVKMAAEKLKKL